jgi:23S rRNA (cytidine2498-2'-O)-methyltransferase
MNNTLLNLSHLSWSTIDIYLAHPDFQKELQQELKKVIHIIGEDLFVAPAGQSPVFALDVWRNPKLLTIESIGDAVKKLKAIQKFWYSHLIACSGRTKLIAEQLPQYKKIKAPYEFPLPEFPNIGVFALLDESTLLYSENRDKKIPDGKYAFVEDKINPPNRAYLKLWEALSVLNKYPKEAEFAIDLGASPGGWTYVLNSFGAKVLAVDKAPLAPHIAKLSGIESRHESIFSLKHEEFASIDWLVCDVACYPERLYEWLLPWLESGKVKQFIVTLKLQGETDFAIIEKFSQIPGAKVLHLYYNKHEVTFLCPGVLR